MTRRSSQPSQGALEGAGAGPGAQDERRARNSAGVVAGVTRRRHGEGLQRGVLLVVTLGAQLRAGQEAMVPPGRPRDRRGARGGDLPAGDGGGGRGGGGGRWVD